MMVMIIIIILIHYKTIHYTELYTRQATTKYEAKMLQQLWNQMSV